MFYGVSLENKESVEWSRTLSVVSGLEGVRGKGRPFQLPSPCTRSTLPPDGRPKFSESHIHAYARDGAEQGAGPSHKPRRPPEAQA
jgi:hypothetical protein